MVSANSHDERQWAMFCHLSALLGYIIPFGHIIGPLVVWLIKKDVYPFVDEQGKESLNFQISMTIYTIISGILCLLLIGFLLLLVIVIVNIVCVILAAIRANDGIPYRYPLTIRFLR